jgi:hypothetical protein
MDYTLFNEDQQYQVVQQKLRGYEIKHYEATINVAVGVATGAAADELAIYEKAVADFAICIEVMQEMLAELAVPEPRLVPAVVPPTRT